MPTAWLSAKNSEDSIESVKGVPVKLNYCSQIFNVPSRYTLNNVGDKQHPCFGSFKALSPDVFKILFLFL